MTDNERLAEIIRADFEEDDVTYKKLNIDRLLESDIIDRFLGFVEEYDKVFGKNVFDTVVDKWLDYGKEDYDCIKYFLMTSSSEYCLPFNMKDFISMTLYDFVLSKEKCVKICALLDEKRALYQEFITFYE